jgi:hypothetical protein
MQNEVDRAGINALAPAAVLVEVGGCRERLVAYGAVGVEQTPPSGGAPTARVHDPNYTRHQLDVNSGPTQPWS